MRKLSWILIVAFAVAALAGCQSEGWNKKYEPGQQSQPGAAGAGTEQGTADQRHGANLGGMFEGKPIDDPTSPLAKRVFYFSFDSSQINPEDQATIAAHARYLAQNPNVSVVLEGHTDERGSREDNMALGQRRAEAVEQFMLLQGASKSQIQVISFGEERPVALGHDEAAWRLNRRVEILYSGTQK